MDTEMTEQAPPAPAPPGPAVAGPKEATPEPPVPPPAPPNPDLEAYRQRFATVQTDPADFNTWTALLTIADRLEDVEKMRAAYDAFLAEYPLCYGYWKKYADAEMRHGNTEMAANVYWRGVAATPYSADLWAHYAVFKKTLADISADDVRGVYERGLAYVASDYNAHVLWDKYLAFEQERGTTLHVASLYSRILTCPIKELDRYYASFKNYVQPLTAGQIIMPHEYEAVRSRLEAERTEAAAKAAAEAKAAAAAKPADGPAVKVEEGGDGAAAPPPPGPDGEAATAAAEPKAEGGDAEAAAGEGVKAEAAVEPAANGDAAPPGEAAAEGNDPKPEPVAVSEEDVKAVWVKQQEAVYEHTKQELLKRKPFEDAARRPYFHIKPLDGVQLFNWIRYLDWIEARGDHTATVTVFERCLVACANYPEFWQRYVRYLEKTEPATAKATLDRAVLGFCKRRPEIHLFAAQFDERHGDIEGARERFKHLLTHVAPRLLEAVTAAANFERRQGNNEAASAYLRQLMEEEKHKEGSRIYPFLTIHYAHFLRRHANDLTTARQALDEALEQCPGVRSLWEAAIHFEELVGGPEAVARALQLYDKCTANPQEGAAAAAAAGRCLPERDREELSARSVDFADMYGSIEDANTASERHAQRFMLPTTVTAEARAAASNKRVADAAAGGHAGGHGGGGGAPHKMQRMDAGVTSLPPPPPMTSSYGSYAAAAAAPAATAAAYSSYYGYGQYPAQAYGAYGAYPGYGY